MPTTLMTAIGVFCELLGMLCLTPKLSLSLNLY